ncbi:GntR family transcriptional regulator [Aliishimia ponticola]|uniref:GntR family transcriptional regulator n=1 Tax=Aliishimia ponticola TaxID=2499833 RepID=A0A4S4N7K9_9RHOB|nr:GntR family transcriptional regulator [Aliishimia ponticola]THH35136.1 GntR family transcriptional regulator [Aliishimia ponticola]
MPDKSPSNSQRAIHELRARIFSGELAAGSDHLESELADMLQMSRTPVREAVLTLEGQGLLELRPRKGVRILPLSPEDMSEIYDVLTELESHAAERAATARYAESDLQALAQAIADMEAALDASDLEAWADADTRFHTELVRLGGNTRIQSIVGMMSDQVRRARMTTLFMRPVPTKSNEDHRRVYQAIRDGDAVTARECHRKHRQDAKKILVDLLAKLRLRYL